MLLQHRLLKSVQSVAVVSNAETEAPARLALAEDFLTAWASDVAGLADFDALAQTPSWFPLRPVLWLSVPSPKGTRAPMPVLHPFVHVALHEAVAPTRELADSALSADVFGYRLGAVPGSRYAADWGRFRDWSRAAASAGRTVVHADVQAFFDHVSWDHAAQATTRIGSDASRLADLGRRLSAAGLTHLPPGYADARLLANLVLLPADRAMDVPFARWVDDYRLSVSDRQEGESALAQLAAQVSALGLRLNPAKTKFVAPRDELEAAEDVLASVYQPDRDPPEAVRDQLLAVLAGALDDPNRKRRSLRFALARLAREEDPSAIGPVLDHLSRWPWDAPRAVAYLDAVAEDPRVRPGVERLLTIAARAADAWMVARLAPLACRLGMASATRSALADALPAFRGTPSWGLGLRVLALGGERGYVRRALDTAWVDDPRAALTAAVDCDTPCPAAAQVAEPLLAEALENGPAPLPSVGSIL